MAIIPGESSTTVGGFVGVSATGDGKDGTGCDGADRTGDWISSLASRIASSVLAKISAR